MAAVVIVAAGVVYFDRKKRSTAKRRILGCLSWNLSCRNLSSPPTTDIAVRAQLRVVPYNPVTRDCDSATRAADESRGGDGRRRAAHPRDGLSLSDREFFIVNSFRINLPVMSAR